MPRAAVLGLLLIVAPVAASREGAPPTLPLQATAQLDQSLAAAAKHQTHVWRDTAPINADGTLNGHAGGSRTNSGCLERKSWAAVTGLSVSHDIVPRGVSYTSCIIPSVATMYEPFVTRSQYASSSSNTCRRR